ncbi:MAG: SUMF1/EgtB/PvdO family nonheme iron enzyme [Chloroflexi bacterium]|nr:SUMF1/EgtB/PvdO family nonheme iron enzyme [Chloroflexota bacterium]
MSNPTIPQDRVSRFLATLRRLGGQNARVLSSGLAVAALASVADPALLAAYPQLASLTALLGGNLLASQIDRMANATSEGELQQTLDQLLANSELAQQVSETQFQQLLGLLSSQATSQQLAEVQSDIQQIAQTVGRLQQGVWLSAGRDVVLGDVVQGNLYKAQGNINIYHAPPSPDDMVLLKPYLDTVVRQSKALRLAPLDAAGQDADKQAISLGQVYVELEASAGEYTLADGQTCYYNAALAHLYYHPHLILLGDPGSGKTTFVRYVASELAQGMTANLQWVEYYEEKENSFYIPKHLLNELEWEQKKKPKQMEVVRRERPQSALIPLYLEMRDFARTSFNCHSPLALWEYAAAQLTKENMAEALPALKRQAQAGRVLWLLDGVDEVPPAQRKEIWQAIAAMHHGVYGGCPWLATCRMLSFKDDEAPPKAHVTTLQPLNQAQIERFIERWYEALVAQGQKSHAEGEALGRQLRHAAQTNLRELAPNPMLLTIMALVQTYRGTLPDERAKLYQACVETLLVRWQQHKDGVDEPTVAASLGVSHTQLEELLAEIAWVAHSKAPEREDSADISEDELIKLARKALGGSYAKAELFVEYTERRAHLLVGKGGEGERFYSFPHRTFQEYLAACHLASVRRFGPQAPRLASQGDMWREVLTLATGELVFNRSSWEYALQVVERVLPETQPAPADTAGWYRVWMAGEMATVIGKARLEGDEEMGRDVLAKVRQHLVALLEAGALTTRQRADVGIVLGQLGDPRKGVGVVDGLPDVAWGGVVPAGKYTIGDGKHDDVAVREVEIAKDYQLAKYPVTYAQFQCFVEAEDFADTRWWAGMPEQDAYGRVREIASPQWVYPNHPRVDLTWYQAVAFARWLSDKLVYEIRLPHEHEWEVAARYNDGRIYPWGHEFDPTKANTAEGGLGQTTAVGLYPTGCQPILGLYDMSGNVREWCQNKYENPTQDEVDASGNSRVWRGGSWNLTRGYARAAYRVNLHPHFRYDLLGLRLVRCSS